MGSILFSKKIFAGLLLCAGIVAALPAMVFADQTPSGQSSFASFFKQADATDAAIKKFEAAATGAERAAARQAMLKALHNLRIQPAYQLLKDKTALSAAGLNKIEENLDITCARIDALKNDIAIASAETQAYLEEERRAAAEAEAEAQQRLTAEAEDAARQARLLADEAEAYAREAKEVASAAQNITSPCSTAPTFCVDPPANVSPEFSGDDASILKLFKDPQEMLDEMSTFLDDSKPYWHPRNAKRLAEALEGYVNDREYFNKLTEAGFTSEEAAFRVETYQKQIAAVIAKAEKAIKSRPCPCIKPGKMPKITVTETLVKDVATKEGENLALKGLKFTGRVVFESGKLIIKVIGKLLSLANIPLNVYFVADTGLEFSDSVNTVDDMRSAIEASEKVVQQAVFKIEQYAQRFENVLAADAHNCSKSPDPNGYQAMDLIKQMKIWWQEIKDQDTLQFAIDKGFEQFAEPSFNLVRLFSITDDDRRYFESAKFGEGAAADLLNQYNPDLYNLLLGDFDLGFQNYIKKAQAAQITCTRLPYCTKTPATCLGDNVVPATADKPAQNCSAFNTTYSDRNHPKNDMEGRCCQEHPTQDVTVSSCSLKTVFEWGEVARLRGKEGLPPLECYSPGEASTAGTAGAAGSSAAGAAIGNLGSSFGTTLNINGPTVSAPSPFVTGLTSAASGAKGVPAVDRVTLQFTIPNDRGPRTYKENVFTDNAGNIFGVTPSLTGQGTLNITLDMRKGSLSGSPVFFDAQGKQIIPQQSGANTWVVPTDLTPRALQFMGRFGF